MPGINQSMTEDDLQSQINAERELQQVKRSWLEHWNFLRGIRQKNIFLEKFKNYVSKSNFLKFLYFFFGIIIDELENSINVYVLNFAALFSADSRRLED